MDMRPPVNRSMRTLDRSFFKSTVNASAIQLMPGLIPEFQATCREDLLQMPRMRRIIPIEHSSYKLVLLNSKIDPSNLKNISTSLERFLKQENCTVKPFTIHLDYDYWNAEQILSSILPADLCTNIPIAFTQVGHIAHMNIPEEYLPYKNIIGQVILDKNSKVTLVVNKLNNIKTKFRTFDMEILAGLADEELFWVEHHESGCRFQFDFRKVYWNSRLHTEHERLIAKFKQGQAVADVFAGVGPFAIPAAKKGVLMFANDLNPESYKSLQHNTVLNKVSALCKAYNLDGVEFIRQSNNEFDAL
jgi:tRNA (guanine37-N1)-methyltransferase